MDRIEYCFFIVSCVKNIQIVEFEIDTIRRFCKEPIDIYVSFDGDVEQKNTSAVYLSGNQYDRFGVRVQKAVNSIPYKYIIVMCDDFIVESEIKLDEINELISVMNHNKKISSIAFAEVSGKNDNVFLKCEGYKEKYIKRNHFAKYKTTFQCSLWNKVAFTALIGYAKNPWEFELFSNQRTYITTNEFYSIVSDEESPIRYNRGAFVIRGKIVVPEKERLERVLGEEINIDGFEYTDSYQQVNPSIFVRILRRIKLITNELLFCMLSLFIKKDINI